MSGSFSAQRFGWPAMLGVAGIASILGAVGARAASAEGAPCPEAVAAAAEAPTPRVAPPATLAAPEPLTDEEAELAAARPPLPPGVEAATFDHEHFLTELRAKPAYVAGAESTVEVVVTAKGEYKLNPQFPQKFKLDAPPEGVTYPKPIVKREDGTFTEKSGTFPVPFVASRAGKAKIAGVVSLSVCSDKRCVMEKIPLDVEIDVR